MFFVENEQDDLTCVIAQVVEDIIQKIENIKPKKKLTFCSVDLYQFTRTQGFGCIPSDSSSKTVTLGMEKTHTHLERFASVEDYLKSKRVEHLARLEEERGKIEGKRQEIENIINGNNFFKAKKAKLLSHEMLLPDYTEAEANRILHVSSNHLDYQNIDIDLPVSYDIFSPILGAEERLAKLVEEGLNESEIDLGESKEILEIQESREVVGCKCGQYGLACGENKNCSCWSNGIGCQVDKQRFPCCCSVKKCKNEFGLKRFDHESVLEHWETTLRSSDLEKSPPAKPIKLISKRKRKSGNTYKGKKRKVK